MSDGQPPANNSLQTLPEGIIELKQTGYQTIQSISQFSAQLDDMTDALHKQGQKSLILVDISGVTGQEPAVLTTVRSRLDGTYDAMAIYSNSTTLQLIVNWLLRVLGNAKKVQYFNDKQAAKDWLLQHNQ